LGGLVPNTGGVDVSSGDAVWLVVPCFDEAERLDLEAFGDALSADPSLHLCFVDDGSRDATPQQLGAFAKGRPERVRVVTLPENVGKAEAVRAGVQTAFAFEPAFVGYWDADLAAPLGELPALRAALESQPAVEVALGARVALLGRSIDRLATRHYLGRVVATLAAQALGVPVYDTQCGAKLFRVTPRTRALFRDPFRTGWTFDVELLARWLRDRRSAGEEPPEAGVVEVPLSVWRHVPGSKVRASDLPRAVIELLRIRSRYR
jgi:glycosyltransferase involved in cell wall biosynthesis